ncbi:MAG: hypothetical protein GX556_12265 [Fibrobacter sp.]|nr:hypothetical protein [Fibrobacter sp.]
MKSGYLNLICLIALLMPPSILALEAQVIELLGNPKLSAPKVHNATITHYLSIPLSSCPSEYWVYYDASMKKMIVEFYGVQVKSPPLDSLKNPVIRNMEVVNQESLMSLSGKRSQITFSIESGWHYDSRIVSKNSLQLKLWRKINHVEELKKKEPSLSAPLAFTLLGAGIISFGLMAFSGRNYSE